MFCNNVYLYVFKVGSIDTNNWIIKKPKLALLLPSADQKKELLIRLQYLEEKKKQLLKESRQDLKTKYWKIGKKFANI